MCHSVTLVRGLEGSLDRPRSSYAFARLIRFPQDIFQLHCFHLFSIFDSSKLFESGFQVSTDESSNPASQHLSFNHLLANAMGSSHRMCKCYVLLCFFWVLKTNKWHMFHDALNSSMPCHLIFLWFLSDFVSVPTWPMLRLLSAARPQSLTFARYLQRWHQIYIYIYRTK